MRNLKYRIFTDIAKQCHKIRNRKKRSNARSKLRFAILYRFRKTAFFSFTKCVSARRNRKGR
ncbi:hypothetical protein [Helicobacter rodentium]|uniref:hypothetical protein n=1 Tax=Helicobacter rodentium TaxID=59617 RepID=UPI0023538FF1|nr:hypothetical protein [Helicobacter rodentium]